MNGIIYNCISKIEYCSRDYYWAVQTTKIIYWQANEMLYHWKKVESWREMFTDMFLLYTLERSLFLTDINITIYIAGTPQRHDSDTRI